MRISRFARILKFRTNAGFTLIEVLISMMILTFGLLALGQINLISMGSASLARSKSNAIVAGADKLESLTHLFRQNAVHPDLSLGNHGPEQVQINNADGTPQNRHNIAWNISTVSDPRSGIKLNARVVSVTVTPVGAGNGINTKASLNKAINISTIIAP